VISPHSAPPAGYLQLCTFSFDSDFSNLRLKHHITRTFPSDSDFPNFRLRLPKLQTQGLYPKLCTEEVSGNCTEEVSGVEGPEGELVRVRQPPFRTAAGPATPHFSNFQPPIHHIMRTFFSNSDFPNFRLKACIPNFARRKSPVLGVRRENS
jgi:hypothetical protein